MHIDLHAHSTHSDGILSAGGLVARAASRGVRVLALTDHDETGGLGEARLQAGLLGVELIEGVEISVTWGGETIHVLGLHIDARHPVLAGGLAALRAARHSRAAAIAGELEKAGIAGSLEGARFHAGNGDLVGRAHFARFLVKQGHARDVPGVFRRYLVAGKPGYVPQQWALLGDALRWIRQSGGLAVIAHPGRYKLNEMQRNALFAEFKDAGGSGVEVVSGSHNSDQVVLYAGYAERYGLLASAGSDFHGPGESRRDLGDVPRLPPGCTPVWRDW